ncbi:MAG: enoyl-CoA hydratase/isomerase family protein [Caldisericia bacterium]|nr:enoyl-CoA hydratase/isomerase family protein [Caldisericia bacterium]
MREEWYNLSFSIENNVGIINLKDKTNQNFISTKFLRELKNGLKVFHHSNDVRVIVITGDATSFSVGISPDELKNGKESLSDFGEFGWKVFNKLSEIGKPVIAEVNGNALDAGFELALLADILYTSDKARFGFPGVKNGVTPAFGGITQLINTAGIRYTRELLYTGRIVSSIEAKQHGIVNEIFPAETLHEEVLAICNKIIEAPSNVICGLKATSGKLCDISRRIHMQDEIGIFEDYRD